MGSDLILFNVFTLKITNLLLLSVSFREMSTNVIDNEECSALPLVITTWGFTNATEKAWAVLYDFKKSVVDTVEAGCTKCEEEQCDYTVGFGGSPDENGETTLDAMVMDGVTMNVGAVGGLRNVKNAIGVARHVLENTKHSILVGESASGFAKSMGFKEESLSTKQSIKWWGKWKTLKKCQPNFWINVSPNPKTTCGPYKPLNDVRQENCENKINKSKRSINNNCDEDNISHPVEKNHDTISMIAIKDKNVAVGTSSNGANHKIPGRIGDAPIVGAGGYADATVGAAVATGDGDVMMRFLPSFLAVEAMRGGLSPSEAAKTAVNRIGQYYPEFMGAIIAANMSGSYGAACNGMKEFPFSVVNPKLKKVVIKNVSCSNPRQLN